MAIDLHIHSIYSDGTLSPDEIVSRASKRALSALSITDHDTAAATEEAISSGKKYGIEIIPGIELSAEYREYQLHVLGYCYNHKNNHMREKLNVLQEAREKRNKLIIAKLQEDGIDISYREVMLVSQTGQTGRPHIGRILVQKKIVKDLNEAFTLYLKKGSRAYVSRFVYSAEEVIEMIRKAGGVAVLAHPYQVDPSGEVVEGVIKKLVDYGLGGVEVYYPSHSKKMKKHLKTLSKKYDLAETGGSDYHGNIRPGTDLAGGINLQVPDEVLDKLRQKAITSH